MYVEEMQDPAFRAALPGDAYALAELAISAGDGVYEFLLQEMEPREMLAGLMAHAMCPVPILDRPCSSAGAMTARMPATVT